MILFCLGEFNSTCELTQSSWPDNIAADHKHMPAIETAPVVSEPASIRTPARLSSLDAYRGFVMLLMASEGLGITQVARTFKESNVWQFLAYQTDHVQWTGCSLWDLIQPSFMFMVGVAMPYSLASRQAKGQPFWHLLLHALWR